VAFLRKIKAGLVKFDVTEFIGEEGNIFFNVETGELRLSDGATPGGLPIYSQGTGGGASINIVGSVAQESDLDINYQGNIGDTIVVTETKDFWLWDGDDWVSIGPLQGPQGFTGSQGIQGELGYTGSQGDIGYTGSIGFVGSQGVVGFTGSQGELGYTGSQGDIGYTGSQGIVGFTGSAGAGATNLIFTEDNTTARLTSYRSDTGEIFTVRTAELTNGTFILNLAVFTPTLSSLVLPASSLSWDVAATAFRVNVVNPTDFTARYISSVRSITQTAGSVSTDLENFTTTGPNVTPAGGVTWQQTFTTNNTSSFIRSTSTSIAGGSASASVSFNEKSTDSEEETAFTNGLTTWTVNWATPTLSAGINNLSGNTFLQTYTSTSYTVAVTGIANNQNFQHTVTGNNGSVSNVSGNGNLTFTNPIHKNNTGIARSVSVSTVFTRPQIVTGTSYSVSLSANSSNVVASFSYPSFWVFTLSVVEPPTREVIVNGNTYRSGVTSLANSTRTFSAAVTNSQTTPRVFWFGVRSLAAQPTTFRTGASSALLSDIVPTLASVQLAPDVVPTGYLNEQYSLYGIILQPGSTFISIS
jgi:hypothetical protein